MSNLFGLRFSFVQKATFVRVTFRVTKYIEATRPPPIPTDHYPEYTCCTNVYVLCKHWALENKPLNTPEVYISISKYTIDKQHTASALSLSQQGPERPYLITESQICRHIHAHARGGGTGGTIAPQSSFLGLCPSNKPGASCYERAFVQFIEMQRRQLGSQLSLQTFVLMCQSRRRKDAGSLQERELKPDGKSDKQRPQNWPLHGFIFLGGTFPSRIPQKACLCDFFALPPILVMFQHPCMQQALKLHQTIDMQPINVTLLASIVYFTCFEFTNR